MKKPKTIFEQAIEIVREERLCLTLKKFKQGMDKHITHQEAKDQVAKKHGYIDFNQVVRISSGSVIESLLNEAADIWCLSERKRTWDEACEAFRVKACARFAGHTEVQLRIGSLPKPEFKP